MTPEIEEKLRKHALWLADENGGERANLSGADLSVADLSRADLSDADLSRADLSDADLRGADLSDANLNWANLYVRALTAVPTDPATQELLKRQSDAALAEYRRAVKQYQIEATKSAGPTGR
jgi:hypothetical protein